MVFPITACYAFHTLAIKMDRTMRYSSATLLLGFAVVLLPMISQAWGQSSTTGSVASASEAQPEAAPSSDAFTSDETPKKRKQRVLPWTDEAELEYWDQASRLWNTVFRSGHLDLQIVPTIMSFKTVADKSAKVGNVPDPAVNGGELIDFHTTIKLGIVLFEGFKLQGGVGTTLTNFKPSTRTEGYDRYGWGFHYQFDITYSPVWDFLSKELTPEFGATFRQGVATSLYGKGQLSSTYLRAQLRMNYEFVDSAEFAFSAYLGLAYQHYFGQLNQRKFSAAAGGGADLPLVDFAITAGLTGIFSESLVLRLEFNTMLEAQLSLGLVFG